MSGRRVRIKGVANIPVRRKNEIPNEKKANNEIEEKKDDSPKVETPEKIKQTDKTQGVNNKNDSNINVESTNEGVSKNKDEEQTNESTRKDDVENKIPESENKAANNLENDKKPVETRFKRWTSRPSVRIASLQRKKPSNEQENLTPSPEVTKTTDKNENLEADKVEKEVQKTQQNVKLPSIENVVKSVTFDSNTNFDSSTMSPNKLLLNRARIKPVPRFNIRRNSFHGSASESEDETRKTQNRTRNDSICSIVNSETGKEDSATKEKQMKIMSHRKIRYTDQSRKLATAKREFQLKFGSQNPDRKRLTMMDLIFYNPTTNPMTEKPSRKNSIEITDPIQLEEEKEDDPNQNLSEPDEPPVPQVKVGPDGEIILDEQSLVIEQTGTKRAREQIENSQIIIDDLDTGYGVYKKPKRCKDWTFAETLRFYRTLNTVGTDFSLMLGLFPGRTRRELKMKFKKEEKNNRMLVDKVLMNPLNFNLSELEEQLQNEKDEDEIFNKKIEIDRSMIKRKKRSKTSVLARAIDDENENEIKRKPVTKKEPKNKSYSVLQKGIEGMIDSSDSENEDSIISVKDLDLNVTDEINVTSNERPTRVCRLKNPSNFEKCFESDNSDSDSIKDFETENQQKLIRTQLQKVGTVVEKMIKLKNKNILDNEVIEIEVDEASFIENEENGEGVIETNIVIAHSENEEPDKIYLDILSKNKTEEGVQNTETKVSLQIKKPDVENQDKDIVNESCDSVEEIEKSSTKPTSQDESSDALEPVKEKSPVKNVSLQSLGNMEPGSLMIMSNLNEKGEKIYKVYMVTPDNEKIPIDLSDDIIQSLTALEEEEEEGDEEIFIDS